MRTEDLFLQFEEEQQDTSLSELLKDLKKEKLSFTAEKICKDNDFSEAFTQTIPDKEEQKSF